MILRRSRWWHGSRPVGWWQRRYGRGFYLLGHGPGGAQYPSRAEAAALRWALESGDVPRRTVRRVQIEQQIHHGEQP